MPYMPCTRYTVRITMNHETDKKNKDTISVFYDGSCQMCTTIIEKIDDSSKGQKFSIQDITKDPLPSGFTRNDVEKEIHVVADGKVYKSAEAILKILEEYRFWKCFVWIGRLPIIKQILLFGYRIIAAHRHALFNAMSRIFLLKAVISLGFIVGLLLSLKLWVSSRLYPLTPVVDMFPPIPYPIDWVILLAIFCLLVAVIVSSKPRIFIWASVVIVSLLLFLDQQRLQPWVYQYVCMFATLGLFTWKWNDVESRNRTLDVCRFIVASIYVWSGLQKINIQFIESVFPWMITPIAQLFPMSLHPTFYAFGILVPFIEMGIGIGLLTRKYRTIAIWCALAMCTFVLSVIGPLGYNWNTVVWPWNIAMAILVVVLFANIKTISLREIVWGKKFLLHKIILIIFGILPFFYFLNMWDSYLSWSLYSGTTNEASMYISDRVKAALPVYIQKFVVTDDSARNVLLISAWSFTELNVPPYPESRIFKNIAKRICRLARDPREVELVMRGRLSWFNRDGQQVLNCLQLH
jgi:predicted DCC family thiol-disulfide oxidoreductase YuxK